MIKTVEPGLLTTVQDEGRWGYQAFGMPVAGAMDRYAYRVANLLTGNRKGAAVLEMTVRGGTFEFANDYLVAMCGADMQPKLDGTKVSNWSAFNVQAGEVLTFDSAVTGCRTYLAIRGGIEVPRVLGSRSTYTRARVGGMEGRPLKAGDVLCVSRDIGSRAMPVVLPPQFIHHDGEERKLRVMLGPQDDRFTPDGIRTFLESRYTVSIEADRMGYRFEGPKIEHAGSADIISDGLPEGAVQVPAHGMPIVMMADRQTTGGYPKIATLIGPDLPLLAQGRPGDGVRFRSCSEREALEALRSEERRYLEIQRFLEEQQSEAWTNC
jgi:antagonist of KipI